MGWSIVVHKNGTVKGVLSEWRRYVGVVSYQGKVLPKTIGAEQTYLTTWEILNSEKSRHRQVGKYLGASATAYP